MIRQSKFLKGLQPECSKKRLCCLRHLIVLIYLYLFTACQPFFTVKSFNSGQQFLELIDQGTLALRNNQIDLARGSFEAAFEISQKAAALDGLGCVAFMEGQLQEAERQFLRATRLDPQYLNSHANLALLYDMTGRKQEAYELYQLVIERQPQNYRARNNFAGYLHDFDRIPEAKNELFKAMAIAKHPAILENLRRIGSYE